ncbi:MAG: asparagine synthase (glutamine-hydrolyzing) [Okeania sp. SIO2F4]|uniref:asparagine synthase (glutamine-hydrolyzing) n=1 Tax=Okeania sp. SIO2F4 TaxID=2607790 RepID=UPI00142CE0B0|nr:asparagine synthase (glutamine-hydrolyzing) [Okeania sp. SIO2F4]NES05442.1 asparagine synthase (glutamine-hydrolyzing) [Okeania sp. SIO2F4]
MCGFAGFVNFKKESEDVDTNRQILQRMAKQLERRGPDDEQIIQSGAISIVFRRLSIVDLAGGSQPIWNDNGTAFVAVNGEIYNYQELKSQLPIPYNFRTQSDCEIILPLYQEYGEKALEKVNGMFALAVWDSKQQELFLARDRFGIKPLYYWIGDDIFVFGSTLWSVLCHPQVPNQLDWNMADRLNQSGEYIIPEDVGVGTIKKLLGGHWLKWGKYRQTTPNCYWNLNTYFGTINLQKTPQEHILNYQNLLVDSVQKRLMSDVPVGVMLSGGLDSGLVAAIASQKKSLHLFFGISELTEQNGDAKAARELSEYLGLPLHIVDIDPVNLLERLNFSLKDFEYYIWMLESFRPDISSIIEWSFKHEIYKQVRAIVPELKVLLLGQGADEFAGGYSQFTIDLLDKESKLVDSWNEYQQDCKNLFDNLGIEEKDKYEKDNFFHLEMQLRLRSLQNHNLHGEDRTSASHGLEVRVPFLDHRLVSYLAAIPTELHQDLFWRKTIVRKSSIDFLPESYRERDKSYGALPLTWQEGFIRQLVTHGFRQFQEKYLEYFRHKYVAESAQESFNNKLENWYINVQNESEEWLESAIKVTNIMSTVIFNNLCETRVQELNC